MTSRRTFLAASGALIAAPAVLPRPASAADIVRVGAAQVTSDAQIFIAEKKGWFAEEGIALEITNFASAANMVAPMGAGQLDVGAGSVSAGLYNAVLRGIKIRVVADKSSSPPGYGPTQVLVRKDHVESGRYKTPADLKGFRFAMNGPGVSNTSTVNTLLTSVGLKYADVSTVNLSFPDHFLAYQNKSVDAGASAEPIVTAAIKAGTAVLVKRDDQIDPYHQLANILYSEAFAARKDIATRFMRAYLRAVRFYNKGLKDGHYGGDNGEDIIRILVENSNVKDAALLRRVTPNGCNPDARVNTASLKKDYDFYASQGWIEGKVNVDDIVDMSFVEAAAKSLGPEK